MVDPDLTPIATRILASLRGEVGAQVGALEPLAGGFASQAFAFTAGEDAYVLRVSAIPQASVNYAKDAYAARYCASPALPIPRAIASGTLDGVPWALSARAPGRTLAELAPAARRALLPALLDTLDAIGRADPGPSRGYGMWGADGNAPHASWPAALLAIAEDDTTGYYAGWHRLFSDSFLERAVVDAVVQRMRQLLPCIPDERRLVHSDLQHENVLAAGGRISAVIDWGNSMWGDPLYDVARLIAWSAMPGWWFDDGEALLRARYGALPHARERLLCYACHIGLDDLRFYAKNGKRAEYAFFRDRLLRLVGKDDGILDANGVHRCPS